MAGVNALMGGDSCWMGEDSCLVIAVGCLMGGFNFEKIFFVFIWEMLCTFEVGNIIQWENEKNWAKHVNWMACCNRYCIYCHNWDCKNATRNDRRDFTQT